MSTPTFDAVCRDHGLYPVERPLGGVHSLALTRLCDTCGMPYDDACPGDLHAVARVVRSAFMNRPDVRVLPLGGPQSPGEAW